MPRTGRPRLIEGDASKNRPIAMTDETSDQLDALVKAERAKGAGLVTRASMIRKLIARAYRRIEKGNVTPP